MAITPSVLLDFAEDLAEPITTAAFDVPAGSLVIVQLSSDEANDGDGLTGVTVTDNNTPDLTWTLIIQRGADTGGGTQAGYVGAWWAYSADAITGLTVTLDAAGSIGTGDCAVKVYGVTGNVSSTDPVGASTSANFDSDPETTASITPETSGVGFCFFSDWNAASHTTTSSDLTLTSFALSSGNLDCGGGYKTLTAAVGATANLNPAAAVDGNYLWFEIRDEGGAAPSFYYGGVGFPMMGVQ